MRSTRETGISGITGKMLTIRHANESERIDIADMMKQSGQTRDISGDEVVVASQENRLLGFAVLTNEDEGRGGRLTLSGVRLHRSIGREVLRHLLDYSTVKRVSTDRSAARHLASLGFQSEGVGGLRNDRERGKRSSLMFARASN